VNRRVYLRGAALLVVALGVVSGLTVYFSTQTTPPCLVSGIPKWRPPTDKSLHRFELVVPDRTLCFFDMDHDQALVGFLPLNGIEGVTSIAPRRDGRLAIRFGNARGALVDLSTGAIQHGTVPAPAPSDTVTVVDPRRLLVFSTRRGVLGFRMFAPATFDQWNVTFPGFTWNPRFGPNPPDHGLSLAPDTPELWVLDAPNNVVHVFDVSRPPHFLPRDLKDIRLTEPLIGKEDPCASRNCRRLGSLQHSADGRFVYVGDSGDVIDTQKREEIVKLEALHQSRLTIEVDWVNGKPEFPGR
jgi:hypothetical protein